MNNTIYSMQDTEIMRRFITKGAVVFYCGAHPQPFRDQLFEIQPEAIFHVLPQFDTIDSYCKDKQIKHIDFLKIGTRSDLPSVLHGADWMLEWGRIAHIRFDYDGALANGDIKLQDIFNQMEARHCGMFTVHAGGITYSPHFLNEFEQRGSTPYLAIHERLIPLYLALPPKMLNLRAYFIKHHIKPRGIIHIGAHEGAELKSYIDMGAERVLFIEANPDIYKKLLTTIDNKPGVIAVQCAISNHNGSIVLHVTSMDQSSSILPLKLHKTIYPTITEEKAIEVPCRTLDALIAELQLDPADYNVLNIDIQGAELLALEGAETTLQHIEAINCEINFEELYAGCAQIWDLDDFLDKQNFDRVATTTPFHPSWGDGLYVKRPLVTMSTLGSNGRFANQLFQYAFLRLYALKHQLKYQVPPWIGQPLFGHKDPPISSQLPLLQETSSILSDTLLPHSKEVFKSVDLWGYFQYHTSYYAAHKELFRTLFTPLPHIKSAMEQGFSRLSSLGTTTVALHLRRGDYGYDFFFVPPNRWYLDWLEEIWPTLNNPVLFIASDEPEKVLPDFSAYHPVTSESLGLAIAGADFYPDFYILSRCDIIAISNSSFSFAACMLNSTGKAFFRPTLTQKRLVPFDPWDSEVVLRDTEI